MGMNCWRAGFLPAESAQWTGYCLELGRVLYPDLRVSQREALVCGVFVISPLLNPPIVLVSTGRAHTDC